VRITFDLAPGLVSDETLYSTPGRWFDADKVRFRFGKPETIGGWTTYNATDLTGICRNALVWKDLFVRTNVAFGTHTKLQVEKGGVLYDITPTGLVAGYTDTTPISGGWGIGGWGMGGWGVGQLEAVARTWSFATWGENLVGSPRGHGIYIWLNDTGTPAALIAQAPSANNCILIPPDSRQIRSFGCNEVSGAYNPSCIRACDPRDYTDWTPASNNNAFEVVIEGGSPIIAARVMGDRDAIWTRNACHLGTFVGGVQKYRVDLIGADSGAAGPNAVCVYNRTAYWLTPDMRFFAWPYGGTPAEIPCPIGAEFRENIAATQTDKVIATPIPMHGEIWWFYPDARDGDPGTENSRYIAFHIEESARAQTPVWSKGTLPRTAAATDSGTLVYPLMVDDDGNSYLHEYGDDAAGSALSWYVTTSAQYLDTAERYVMMRSVWPDIERQVGSVALTLFGQDWPQDTSVETFGPYALAVNANKYDFLAQARLVSVKYSGSAAGTFARIGKPAFDVAATGQY
jgi:hypothetical protein